MKRALLLDATYLIRRCIHVKALAELHDASGRPTGGCYGIINTIRTCIEACGYVDKVVAVWDGGRSARRLALFPPDPATKTGYKAHRGITPDMKPEEREKKQREQEMVRYGTELSIPLLRAMGIHVIQWPEREADDVVAALARRIAGSVFEQVVIASDDWDYAQCADERICVYRPANSAWVGLNNVMPTLNVPIDWLVFKKAVEGDASDNIPGVSGAGPKAVTDIVREWIQFRKGVDWDADFYNAHQYRDTCPADLTPFFDYCAAHRLRKPQAIGTQRDIVLRNMELVDLRREFFPPEHIEQVVGMVMTPLDFDDVSVMRQFGDLNISSLIENFAGFSKWFRGLQ